MTIDRGKRPLDPNQLAKWVVDRSTGETQEPKIPQIGGKRQVVEISTGAPVKPKEKNAAAVALGKLGGQKGGNARAAKLSDEQRSQIAQRAAKQRWAKAKEAL